MAELRRNPLTRKWIIYPQSNPDFKIIDERKTRARENHFLYPLEKNPCPYCPGSPSNHATPILYVSKNQMFYARSRSLPEEWSIKVQSAQHPVFRIEDELNRKGVRLYDTMGSPGAHEVVIMSNTHGKAIWDFTVRELEDVFTVVNERMRDLLKDPRLGHQFVYHIYGQDIGFLYNHAIMNLVVSPFIPEKIQCELSGAHDYFKMKERCLFCDIYEEELMARQKDKQHGLIEESDAFVAYVPFFSSFPFEVWIQPTEHSSDFLNTSSSEIAELSLISAKVFQCIHQSLGPIPIAVMLMNQPNIKWGISRGYWDTIHLDWHWSLRILPDFCWKEDEQCFFNYATGSRINSVLPEHGAEYLRNHR
ncbi:hypothetical protein JW979_15680 [bacterium]|nr:hypothetical protein [candidate division CSSED10-310 bacterium]